MWHYPPNKDSLQCRPETWVPTGRCAPHFHPFSFQHALQWASQQLVDQPIGFTPCHVDWIGCNCFEPGIFCTILLKNEQCQTSHLRGQSSLPSLQRGFSPSNGELNFSAECLSDLVFLMVVIIHFPWWLDVVSSGPSLMLSMSVMTWSRTSNVLAALPAFVSHSASE